MIEISIRFHKNMFFFLQWLNQQLIFLFIKNVFVLLSKQSNKPLSLVNKSFVSFLLIFFNREKINYKNI